MMTAAFIGGVIAGIVVALLANEIRRCVTGRRAY